MDSSTIPGRKRRDRDERPPIARCTVVRLGRQLGVAVPHHTRRAKTRRLNLGADRRLELVETSQPARAIGPRDAWPA
jgi:hypothetical protein